MAAHGMEGGMWQIVGQVGPLIGGVARMLGWARRAAGVAVAAWVAALMLGGAGVAEAACTLANNYPTFTFTDTSGSTTNITGGGE